MLKKENHSDNDNVNVNVHVITSLRYCEMESAKFNILVWRRSGAGGRKEAQKPPHPVWIRVLYILIYISIRAIFVWLWNENARPNETTNERK